MTLTSIKPGDIVRCDVKGRVFLAMVVSKAKGKLVIDPVTPNVNYYEVTARQVICHWRKAGRS